MLGILNVVTYVGIISRGEYHYDPSHCYLTVKLWHVLQLFYGLNFPHQSSLSFFQLIVWKETKKEEEKRGKIKREKINETAINYASKWNPRGNEYEFYKTKLSDCSWLTLLWAFRCPWFLMMRNLWENMKALILITIWYLLLRASCVAWL